MSWRLMILCWWALSAALSVSATVFEQEPLTENAYLRTVEAVNAGAGREPWPAGVYHNQRVGL
ncbi:MAG: hypothetical protein LBK71_04810 [Verrucomicrobiales bacterium]|nr:hypothetical protein [Verrucomicrobiales bacterium]